MAVVAGVVSFTVRALLALIPALTVSLSIKMGGRRRAGRRRLSFIAVRLAPSRRNDRSS
jgi:hypothetical protein